jgi:hypothetical protein
MTRPILRLSCPFFTAVVVEEDTAAGHRYGVLVETPLGVLAIATQIRGQHQATRIARRLTASVRSHGALAGGGA